MKKQFLKRGRTAKNGPSKKKKNTKQIKLNADKDMEQKEFSVIAGENVK